jgi:hypothetical protein
MLVKYKRGIDLIERAYHMWKFSHINNIFNAYKTKPSKAKQMAWDAILNECISMDGNSLRIVYATIYKFTCGFVYEKDGEKIFRYYLPLRILEIPVSELA